MGKKCSHNTYSISVTARYAPAETAPCVDDHLGGVLHLEDPPGVAPHLVVRPPEDRRSDDLQYDALLRGEGE